MFNHLLLPASVQTHCYGHLGARTRHLGSALLLVLTLLLGLTQPVAARPSPAPQAQTTIERWVTPGGDDSKNCTRTIEEAEDDEDEDTYIYNACASITRALAVAGPGDVIRVAAGSYGGALTIILPVTIIGGYFPGFGQQIDPPRFPISQTTSIVGGVSINNPFLDTEVKLDGVTVSGGPNSGVAISSLPGIPIKVTLDGVTVTGNGGAQGAGVRIIGIDNELNISGGAIRNNTATSQGGGLYVGSGARVTVGGGTEIRNNSAPSGAGIFIAGAQAATLSGFTLAGNTAGSNGGGIYLANGALDLGTDSMVTGNQAANGAGVYVASGSPVLSNAVFQSNIAAGNGGGVYIASGSPALTGLSLISNSAQTGAGVYLFAGTPQITGNSILSNTASSTTGGGGIAIVGGTPTISANTYTANRALNGSGGGLYVAGGTFAASSQEFVRNQATDGGGAYFTGVPGASLTNPIFTENHASRHGGGLYAGGGGLLTLTGPSFTDNTAQNGAGLYLTDRTLTGLATAQFQGNQATGNGGGLYLATNAIATFNGLDLQENLASNGGGFYRAGGQLTVTGAAAFLGNIATGDGGAFHLTGSGSALGLVNLFAQNNEAANGGAFYANGVSLNLGKLDLLTNQATGSGGAAYLTNATLTVTATATLISNEAGQHGGAIYANNSTVSFTAGTTYQRNGAENGDGGALYLTGSGSAGLGVATFQENLAEQNGGGVYANGVTVTLAAGSQVIRNSAQFAAGGGFFVNNAPLALGGVALNGNTAMTNGGGLYVNNGAVTLHAGTLIHANEALAGAGGGGYVTQSSALALSKVTFTGNVAQTDGGGLYVTNSTISATQLPGPLPDGAAFSDNHAKGRGGALFVAGGSVAMQRVTVTGNRGDLGGGGLHVTTGVFALADSALSQNDGGSGPGGALYLQSSGAVFSANTVQQNKAATGAGFHLVDTPLATVTAGQFVDNQARTTGGGLALHNSRAEFTGTALRGNQASSAGGGIHALYSRIGMTNTLVVRNTLTDTVGHAAGIYLGNSELDARHITVADNGHQGAQGVAAGIVAALPMAGSPAQSTVTLRNSIVSGQGVGLDVAAGNSATFAAVLWNNTGFDWTGAGTFSVSGSRRGSPAFVNPGSGDYAIRRESAAFDQGIATTALTDRNGIARTQGFAPDLGAHEHRYTAGLYLRTTTTRSGGGAPFVQPGENLVITFQVRNQSAATANAVVLTVNLPNQLPAPSISPGSCQGIFCQANLGNLAPGAGATVVINVAVAGTPSAAGLVNLNSSVTLATANLNDSDKNATARAWLHGCRAELGGTVYTSVQAAVDAASPGSTVRISGVCGDLHTNGGPGQLLTLAKNITLEGGWNAAFTVFNPAATPAILDTAGQGRLLYLDGALAPTLAHLTLRNGTSSGLGGGPAGKDAGGAVYIRQATPTFTTVEIAGSQSPDLGGGVYVSSGSLSIPSIDAVGPVFNGGGIRTNTAGERGGGLYVHHAVPRLTGVEISRNQARAGGGVYLLNSPAHFLDNAAIGAPPTCRVDENLATGVPRYVAGPPPVVWRMPGGGGALALDGSAAQVRGCAIGGNQAMTGGGLYVHAGSPLGVALIENSLLTFNRAMSGNLVGAGGVRAGDGGGALLDNLNPAALTFRGNLLAHNEASRGAAMLTRLGQGGTLSLPHFTIHSNRSGPTVVALGESRLAFANTIVAYNEDGATFQVVPGNHGEVATIDLNHTLWQPAAQQPAGGAGLTLVANYTGDPAFRDDGLRIKRISAAYSQGNSEFAFPDRDGTPRPVGMASDLGASEHPIAGTVRYVALNGTGATPCSDYRFPCPSLQTALDAAIDGDFIKMAGGTYTGVRTDDGRIHHARVTKSVTIQGGYFPRTDNNNVTEGEYTLFDWEVPYPNDNPTVIDAGNGGRGLWIGANSSPTLAYLTIRRGNAVNQADGPAGSGGGAGGGIYIDGATPVLRDVIVRESAAVYGAGLYLRNAGGLLTGLTVANNQATWGGGLYIQGGQPEIRGLTIQANQATTGAGAVADDSAATLTLNTFLNNGSATTLDGGALTVIGGTTEVLTNTVRDNFALRGGGITLLNSSASLRGNVIENNRAGSVQPPAGQTAAQGGGLYIAGGSPLLQGNNIRNNQVVHPVTALGGGVYIVATTAAQPPIRVLTNSISSNQAHRGGGLYLQAGAGDVLLQSNQIRTNLAVASDAAIRQAGGGVYLASDAATTGVVTLDANTLHANRAHFGGGFYAAGSGPHILAANLFTANQGDQDGGGLYLEAASPTLTGNTIEQNLAQQGRGGGLFAAGGNASLQGNLVAANRAGSEGGGLYLRDDATLLRGDEIRANQAADGAGIYVQGPALGTPGPRLEQVTVDANIAGNHGGGLYLRGTSAQLLLSAITANQAAVDGGGLVLDASTLADFSANLIRSNRAGGRGGGLLYTRQSSGTAHSNAVVDNQAASGGGIAIIGAAPTLVHTTLARNGTGLLVAPLNQVAGGALMTNTIIAVHSLGVQVDNGASANLTATLWDSNTTDQSGPGSFVNNLAITGSAAFAGDGIRITPGSAAIGAGISGNFLGSIDIDSEARFQGVGPELGADELTSSCAVIVNNTGQVYSVLQQAIDAAPSGAELRLAGSCSGVENREGTPQVAYINKVLTLRGGYRSGENADWTNADPVNQPTVLDARGAGRVLRVVDARVTLIGLTLINGDATGLGGGPAGEDAGGGVHLLSRQFSLDQVRISGSAAAIGAGLFWTLPVGGDLAGSQIADSIFRTNRAQNAGGAIYLVEPTALLQVRNNTIAENSARLGAGVYMQGGTGIVLSNRFSANQAGSGDGQGGGIYLANSATLVNRNRLFDNGAALGGGIYAIGGAPLLTNNLLVRNRAASNGAALYLRDLDIDLRHHTLVGNLTTAADGSAVLLDAAGRSLVLTNNILVDHPRGVSATTNTGLLLRANLWHNNTVNWVGPGNITVGAGNIQNPPGFVAAAAGDYRLTETSAAIDRGLSAGVNDDFEGQSRPARQGFDIGADEYQRAAVNVTVTPLPNLVAAGEQVTFIIQVLNNGDVDVTADVVATLPAAMTPTGPLAWSTIAIARGGVWTQNLVVTISPAASGILQAVVAVTTAQGASGLATGSVTAAAITGPILDASGETVPDPVTPGDTVELRIRLVNRGAIPLQAVVRAELPDGLSSTGAVVFSPTIGGPDGLWSATLLVTVAPDVTDDLDTRFLITSVQGVTGVFSVTARIARPAVAIGRTVSPQPVSAGGLLTYRVAVTNTGNTPLQAVVRNTFPSQVALPSPDDGAPWSLTLAPGANFQRIVTAAVEAGYVGPLTGAVTVETDSGATATSSETVQSVAAILTPTATAKGGDWFAPDTWEPPGVPSSTASVEIPADVTIFASRPIQVGGLRNRGTLHLSNQTDTSQELNVTGVLENSGEIRGADAIGGGRAGLRVNLNVGILLNDGVICGGKGAPSGGPGGGLVLFAQAATNRGLLCAGDGADSLGGSVNPTGGAGGDVVIVLSPGLFSGSGQIVAGNGGDSADATPPVAGGAGGSITILSDAAVRLAEGEVVAGTGGEGSAGAPPGAAGRTVIGAPTITTGDTVFRPAPPSLIRAGDSTRNFTILGPTTVRVTGGIRTEFTLRIVNRSAQSDSYAISALNLPVGWGIHNLPSTLSIAAFRSRSVTIGLDIPFAPPPQPPSDMRTHDRRDPFDEAIRAASFHLFSIVVVSQSATEDQVVFPVHVSFETTTETRLRLPAIFR